MLKVGETRVDVDTFDRDESAPVSFAFLLDTSGSMGVGNKLENAKNAIRTIIRSGRPGDDFALFAFSEGDVRLVSDFSPDPGKLVRALWDLEASGQTALFDAVAATPERMMKGRNNKRAILLFTDGVDNASQLSSNEMAELLQHVSVPVYTIGMKNRAFDALTEKSRRELSVDTLEMLANSSGGRMHLVSGDEDLRPLATAIAGEVRQQYLLGFAPSGKGDVKYRIVFVSVVKPGSWVVRTRRGYRGTVARAVRKPFLQEVQMHKSRRVSVSLAGGALLLGTFGLTACASKKYVGEEVSKSSAVTEKRINDVESQVEATQTKVKQHDAKLTELDTATRQALERAQQAGKLAEGKFVYSLVLSDDAAKFPVNKHELSPEAQEALNAFAERLKGENKNVYLEIQGHTDATGSDSINLQLGEARAEAVRRYLNKQGVALNRMSTISYGSAEPVESNKTKEGRSKNRRVVVVVLA